MRTQTQQHGLINGLSKKVKDDSEMWGLINRKAKSYQDGDDHQRSRDSRVKCDLVHKILTSTGLSHAENLIHTNSDFCGCLQHRRPSFKPCPPRSDQSLLNCEPVTCPTHLGTWYTLTCLAFFAPFSWGWRGRAWKVNSASKIVHMLLEGDKAHPIILVKMNCSV